ncbi:hypothetical protein [Actinokineospora globicatena]|uniref:hypothetical protein n=1 Tax=Actinokineospora globicatena TaxID=103729 RepID=UPI0020A2355D|nr:hypothetical protein [Actinokineospora globicatena]MCP2304925.1 hypothetical protein [Actinokineospora globicatena]GLW77692.1 hypothetical protein Aglo01_21740 [Actinokineospora globicatena]GLW85639.1 hypothetical protein Aglo02_32790 [Actinokineospora globicatena]
MATPITAPRAGATPLPHPAAAQASPRLSATALPVRERTVRQARTPVRPGSRLREAVQRVQADPANPGAVADLMAGLAWTAAAGETCLLTRPVADVRHAIAAIAAADTASARAALDHAVAGLLDAPALPLPRPATAFERRSI